MTDQLEMLDGLFDDERRRTIQTVVATSDFLDTISTGMIFRDVSGRMVDCNHAAETILGVSRASLLGKIFSGVGPSAVRLDGTPFDSAEELILEPLRSGRGISGIIAGVTVADGSQRWVSMRVWPHEVGGSIVGVMTSFDDVTSVVREQRVIQILAGVKRVGLMNVSEAESLQLICDLVVNEGHLPLAWVGVASTEGGVDIVASAGATEYLYDGMVSWWGSSPSGLGPTGTALRTSVSQVANDLADEPLYGPWKDRSREFNLASAVALPFALENRKAVISIYDTHVNGFDERTVSALEDVAATIGASVVLANAEYQKRVAMEATLVAVTSLEEAKLSLSKSEQWFRTLVAKSSDLIVVIDEEARLRYVNPFVDRAFGYPPNSQIGRDLFELIHPDDHSLADEAFEAATSPGGMDHPVILRFLTASGEWRFIEGVVTNCLDDDAVRGVVGNGRDVTERVYLTRALRTLSEGSQVLVHAQDEATLIREISKTIVSVGGYPVAWVGYVEHDEAQTIRVTEPAGILETLTGLHFSWGDGEAGRGPVADAVRTGRVQVINDLLAFPLIPERRERAERYGLRSMCAFPLKVVDEVVGVVSIYSEHVNSFRPEEVETLGELVDELAYGISRLRDAARLAQNEALIRSSDERFRLAFEHNMAPMLFSDFEDRVIAVNDSFCQMVGFSREELLGHDSKQFTYPDDVGITEDTLVRLRSQQVGQVRYVKRYLRKDGRVIISEVSRSAARDASGKVLYFVSSERDVTEERTLAEQLSHQALHDSLTGLANRALFEDRLAQAHARVLRQGGLGAVLLLDLDDFKGVNDAHGHLVGDQLLAGIARRFELVTRSSDTLSRFGGDEFLYLAEGLNSVAEAEEVADRLIDVLAEPFSFDGISLAQHASVGIVVWDNTCENAGELIQKADVAMYEAKRLNRGRHSLFTPSMHLDAVSHFELVQQLRRALQTDDLTMHYQPIVNLDTVEVVGFEALMRWRHGDRGWVRPDIFIPLAEKSDLILELGTFALTDAIMAASTWTGSAGATPPYVAVNLSAHQFHDPGLVDTIRAALAKSGLAPNRLVIEITESAMLLNVGETMNTIERIGALGVGFALDDFGTGYSSLSYLALLQPTIIKIDQSFVSPAEESARNDTLLEAIISLGQKLGMTMSAEGIETRAQFNRLRRLGCDYGQGYLWSPAVAGDQVEALLTSVNGRRNR